MLTSDERLAVIDRMTRNSQRGQWRLGKYAAEFKQRTRAGTRFERVTSAETNGWNGDRALGNLAIRQVRFQFSEATVFEQGYAKGPTIAIHPGAMFPVSSLIHEAAHVLLGHSVYGTGQRPAGIREFQANATAAVVLTDLGADHLFDELALRANVRSQLRGEVPTVSDRLDVMKVAARILEAGR